MNSILINNILNIILKIVDFCEFIKNSIIMLKGWKIKIVAIGMKKDFRGINYNGLNFFLKTFEPKDEKKLKFLASASDSIPNIAFFRKTKVFLVNQDFIIKNGKKNNCLGFTRVSNSTYFIYLRNDLELNTLKLTFYHELGHVFDLLLSGSLQKRTFSKQSKTFKSIFEKEKWFCADNGKLSYYGKSIDEYFAQVFYYTVIGETEFINVAPNTYDFMLTLIFNNMF